jgi:hypothetical protein
MAAPQPGCGTTVIPPAPGTVVFPPGTNPPGAGVQPGTVQPGTTVVPDAKAMPKVGDVKKLGPAPK